MLSSLVIRFSIFQIAFSFGTSSVSAKSTHCGRVLRQAWGHSLLQRTGYEHQQVVQLEATNGTEPELEREQEPANGSSNGTDPEPEPEPERDSPNGTEPEPANVSLPCPNQTGQIPLEANQKFQESCHMHLNESLGVNESLGEMEKDSKMSRGAFFAVMESMCQEGTPEHDECFGQVIRYFTECDVDETNITRWKEGMDQFCGMLRLLSSAASSILPSLAGKGGMETSRM